MDNIYKFKVEPQDVDFTKRARVAGIFSQILNTAGFDADRNGFGVLELNKANSSWVLLRINVAIDRLPDEYEQYNIETWISDYSKLFSTRNFKLIDSNGKQFGASVSQWAMIDLTTRRPLDVRTLGNKCSEVLNIKSPLPAPAKILPFEPEITVPRKIVYSDIDFNMHVNSVKYFEWAFDMLPIDIVSGNKKIFIDINFLREMRYGATLTLNYKSGDPHLFEIKNSENTVACRISIDFK